MVLIGGHGANPMGESIVPLNSMGLDDVIKHHMFPQKLLVLLLDMHSARYPIRISQLSNSLMNAKSNV